MTKLLTPNNDNSLQYTVNTIEHNITRNKKPSCR